MMHLIKISLIILFFVYAGCNETSKVNSDIKNDYPESFLVEVSNPLNISRADEIIQLDIKTLREKYKDFNPNAFIVFDDTTELPSQTEDFNADNVPDKILFITDLNSNESKIITIRYSKDGEIKREYEKRTQAVLGEKKDYKLIKGEYADGKFENVNSAKVPKNHFAHDALYRIEGPGWESELIAYRFYLDSRNRNDLFGKKVNELILQKLGVDDLVSNSKESYTQMLDWGMDIFKVGESLGLGSIGMWVDNKVNNVSNTDSVETFIADNGVIQSSVYTRYFGWLVDGKKFNLNSNLSISAASRLTDVNININDNAELCTGLAKHENTEYFSSKNKSGWNYIAQYGKQSLPGDNLGITVFYNNSDLVKLTEDDNSYIVILKTSNGKLNYYFAAAWEEEPDGIKNKNEFENYLNTTITELNNPIKVILK